MRIHRDRLLARPWRDLRDVFDWDRSLNSIWERPEWGSLTGGAKTSDFTFNPACEVTEDKGNYTFKFDLPGIPKDQVKVEIHENQLIVSGERKEEKKEEDKRNHFSEVFYGSFMRAFTLPTAVNPEAVHAVHENGVLRITVPKEAQKVHTRQVPVR